MAILLIHGLPGAENQKQVPKQRQLIIGRDSTCDVIIPRQAVSRFHVQILPIQGEFFLEDLGSTNGTILNGRRLRKRERLADGDLITFGDVTIEFSLAEQMDHLPVPVGSGAPHLNAVPPVATVPPGLSINRVAPAPRPPAANALTETMAKRGGGQNLKGQLTTLIEITRNLGSSLRLDDILPRVLDLLFKSFPQANFGEIHLVEADGKVRPVAMKHGRDADSTDLTGAPLNVELIEDVLHRAQGMILNEGNHDLGSALDEMSTCTICAPILSPESTPGGVIILQSEGESVGFSQDELDLVCAVGVIAGQSIAYAQAHEIVLRHYESERQLETARHVQLSTLPHAPPQVPGYQFCHHYSAAERVGGDYFFYEMMRDGRVIFGIADASGKGLPAAMHITRFAGEVKLRIATSPTLKVAVSRLNRFILEWAEDCMFITACIGVLDPAQHSLTLANAGHPPPLRKRPGETSAQEVVFAKRSFPLGISDQLEVHPVTLQIDLGDQLIFYTDGISEAMNPCQELFGMARFSESLQIGRTRIEESIASVVDHVARFRQGRAQSDDMTIVGFERLV